MTPFVTLESVSLAAPDSRLLVPDLTLAFGRERTGVVGRNGSGKSSLIDLLAGRSAPIAGTIARAGSAGILDQMIDAALTLAEAMGVAPALARLRRIEDGRGTEEDLAEADWTLQARTESAFAAVHLAARPLDTLVGALSGGERTRVALARLVLEAPDLLLLDEPTNNLDAEGRRAVLGLLNDWRGGVVVASHDRAVLDQVDRILELTPAGATLFGGAWSEFVLARDAARARVETEADRAGRDLKRTEREVQAARERQARRDKGGRVKAAKGDAPKILLGAQAERAENSAARGDRLAERRLADRIETLEAARARLDLTDLPVIDMPRPSVPAGRLLLVLNNAAVVAGGRPLVGPLSFEVRGPERIVLRGPNGSGKTSLMRLIMGQVAPYGGEVRRLTPRIAMLEQHLGALAPSASVLDNLCRLNPGLTDNEARAALARFAFRNRAALQTVGALSGGERMRAGLACALAGADPPELLLLDEPTNHLDFEAIEALEQALGQFDGAMIVVSHDEAFLQALSLTRALDLSP